MESKKDLKKLFPHLFNELESSENKVKIDALRKNSQEAEAEVAAANEIDPDAEIEADLEVEDVDAELELEVPQPETAKAPSQPDKFRHYNPTVIDFLRRCDTADQVEEIIAFMCKKGELTQDHATQLRTQLKKDGVRSFGPKKETDYYFKESGLC